jgi:antitoxin component YwqK of YwqJK toxin-antitoxin module
MQAVVSNYKNGQLHGIQKKFDKRGRIISTIEYKNGLRDRMYYSYDTKGKVTSERKFSKGLQVVEGTNSGSGFNPSR